MPAGSAAAISEYAVEVTALLGRTFASQQDRLERFAALWADAISNDKLLYVFGSGHSRFIAGELYWRAGGLAPVVMIDDPSGGTAERLEGYAATFVEQYAMESGDIVLVISNSGINAAPLEVALHARSKGATVVALTSLAHAGSVAPRHSSAKKLHEVADLVVDTCIPPGDALLALDDGALRAGPASTVVSTALLNAVVVQTARNLLEAGAEAPVLISANVAEGDSHNRRLASRYWRRLTKFPRLGQI